MFLRTAQSDATLPVTKLYTKALGISIFRNLNLEFLISNASRGKTKPKARKGRKDSGSLGFL